MAGRIAVVTGASSGIGRATAHALAREGADLALLALPGNDLTEAELECAALGARAIAIPTDVSSSAQVAAAFTKAETLGPVSAVFNNAGVCIISSLADMTDEQWLAQLTVNLTGCVYVAREAARRMAPRRYGAIVNTASELTLIGQAGYVAYTATKGGILAMTRALAAELAPSGIRVNAVCPGATDTPMLASEYMSALDPVAERMGIEATIALGRFAQPAEIAQAVLFLLSDEASYVTGTHLAVDGGRTGCIPMVAPTVTHGTSRVT
jgi:NAD(P)-dependent dehydrogenase (short-subunit alcohol dehydrogenase family)